MRGVILTALLLAFYFPAMDLRAAQDSAPAAKEPKLSGQAAFGKLIYNKVCASCHGANGAGSTKGPSFLHRVYHPGHHADQAFFRAVTNGARAHHWKFGDMPPVQGINRKDVEMIIEYVRAVQRANGMF